MDVLERIKKFFRNLNKQEQKLLTDGNNVKEKVNTLDRFKVKQVNFSREPSIEECFDEFIKQYAIQEEINEGSPNNAYNAFRRMFCDEEEKIGNNLKNQEALKKSIKKKGCETAYQASNNRISFMHIAGKEGLDERENLDITKLYINCDRKNISLLTAAIFDKIEGIAGDKLQMKCVCEQFLKEDQENEQKNPIKGYQRNEKIVIYAENYNTAERMADEINELTYEKPELFSTTKKLPFLPKKYGFIGIVKKEPSEYAKTPVGIASGRTYNDYMSDIVSKCIISGFDSNLKPGPQTLKEPLSVRMGKYSKIYSEIEPEQRSEILSESREIFEQVCRENNVKTVYRQYQSTEKDKNREIGVV